MLGGERLPLSLGKELKLLPELALRGNRRIGMKERPGQSDENHGSEERTEGEPWQRILTRFNLHRTGQHPAHGKSSDQSANVGCVIDACVGKAVKEVVEDEYDRALAVHGGNACGNAGFRVHHERKEPTQHAEDRPRGTRAIQVRMPVEACKAPREARKEVQHQKGGGAEELFGELDRKSTRLNSSH